MPPALPPARQSLRAYLKALLSDKTVFVVELTAQNLAGIISDHHFANANFAGAL
jgi:prophage maintenance system killer protein